MTNTMLEWGMEITDMLRELEVEWTEFWED